MTSRNRRTRRRPTVDRSGWSPAQETTRIEGWTIRLHYAPSTGRAPHESFVAYSDSPGRSLGGYVFHPTRKAARAEMRTTYRNPVFRAFVARMIIHLSVETSEAGR